MKLRKASYFSPFTEVAGKGRKAFHRETECSERKSRVLDFEDICWMGAEGFAGWIGVKNNSENLRSEEEDCPTAYHALNFEP
jgi:hypothetical protein